jgi:hypothetical protein
MRFSRCENAGVGIGTLAERDCGPVRSGRLKRSGEKSETFKSGKEDSMGRIPKPLVIKSSRGPANSEGARAGRFIDGFPRAAIAPTPRVSNRSDVLFSNATSAIDGDTPFADEPLAETSPTTPSNGTGDDTIGPFDREPDTAAPPRRADSSLFRTSSPLPSDGELRLER